MYCKNCGNEVAGGSYCQNCGTYAGECVEVVAAEPLTDAQRMKKALSSKLLMAVAILVSVNLGLSVLGSIFFSLYGVFIAAIELPAGTALIIGAVLGGLFIPSVALSILETVAYWKTYKLNKDNSELNAAGLRLLTIHTKIFYVLTWVSVAFILLVGILCIAAAVLSIAGFIPDTDGVFVVMIIIGVMMFIIAAVCVVLQILYNRKVIKFFKQLTASAESGEVNIENVGALHTWMLVLGIIGAVGGISGGGSLVSSAAKICLSFWIKENFLKDA